MYNNDTFISNVKGIIQSRGLKQRSVALKSGINEKSLSDMLNKRKKILPVDIAKLCIGLEVEPNELFGIVEGVQ